MTARTRKPIDIFMDITRSFRIVPWHYRRNEERSPKYIHWGNNNFLVHHRSEFGVGSGVPHGQASSEIDDTISWEGLAEERGKGLMFPYVLKSRYDKSINNR